MKEKPIIYVDFNEMVEPDLVLLSQKDFKKDKDGNDIHLVEGMLISVYMDDEDINGKQDDLIANGVIELNTAKDWSSHIKWCCRIDERDICNESDVKNMNNLSTQLKPIIEKGNCFTV